MEYVPPTNGDTEDPDRVYTDGTAGVPGSGSIPPAEFFNTLQAELLALIEGASLTPDSEDLAQLLAAVNARAAAVVAALAVVHSSNVVDAGYFSTPEVLAIETGEVDFDVTDSAVFTLDVDENIALNLPTVPAGAGGMFILYATQDATGGRTLTLASGYEIASGAWDTTADAVNILWGTCDGSGTIDLVIGQRGAA
jgi:hypothetical protein